MASKSPCALHENVDKCNVEITFLMFHGPTSKFFHRFRLFESLVFPVFFRFFVQKKTNAPYILLFSFAKALGNSYIVNSKVQLARNKSRIR